MRDLLRSCLAILVTAGCGAGGGTSASGAVNGIAAQAQSAVFDYLPARSGANPNPALLFIAATNGPDPCSILGGRHASPNQQTWSMVAVGTPPGAFVINAEGAAYPLTQLWFRALDESCAARPAMGFATSGTIHIDSFDGARVAGSADARFGEQGSVALRFDTDTACAAAMPLADYMNAGADGGCR